MKNEFNYRELDSIIHSRVRLGIMTVLITGDEVEFKFLKEKLKLSDGNLSVNMSKLEDAGFVETKKFFFKKKPKTVYKITKKGRKAFKQYIENLEKIIEKL